MIFLKNSLATDFLSDFFFDFFHFSGKKWFFDFFSIFSGNLPLFFKKTFFLHTFYFFWKFPKKVKKRWKNHFFSQNGKMPFFLHIFDFFWNFANKSQKNYFFFLKIHWRPIFWVIFFFDFFHFSVKNDFFKLFYNLFGNLPLFLLKKQKKFAYV